MFITIQIKHCIFITILLFHIADIKTDAFVLSIYKCVNTFSRNMVKHWSHTCNSIMCETTSWINVWVGSKQILSPTWTLTFRLCGYGKSHQLYYWSHSFDSLTVCEVALHTRMIRLQTSGQILQPLTKFVESKHQLTQWCFSIIW